ncbi:beta-ketoacyl synthase N-terminal-like domain-containing protein, partial [Actinoplanes couchii]|uniref:type I polyketide synthase n=3 Tax=Actinoplanes couchii TaxID=403638 RepID=UPI0031D81AFA
VDGTWVLHEALPDVDAFVVFSSAAGVLGSGGQGNYAAANVFMDALMAWRRERGLAGTSLAWGYWADDSGLTAHLGEADRARIAGQGLVPMSVEVGLGLFDVALAFPESLLVLTPWDAGVLRQRAREDRLPVVLRSLVKVPVRRVVAQTGEQSLEQRLAGMPVAAQREALAGLVLTHTAAVLGHGGADGVDASRAFKDLGFDSLTAVELRNRLNSATGLRLPATLVFDHPTPDDITTYLQQRLTGDRATAGGPAAAVTPAGPELDDAVAVVAMACRFPGGVGTPEDLWELLESGADTVTGFPTDRGWDAEELYDPDPRRVGKTYVKAGSFVEDVAAFDAGFFGISGREAAAMDPQQRLLLEMAWEVCERAGIDPSTLKGTETGVYTGVILSDYLTRIRRPTPEVENYLTTGGLSSVVSGRIAYTLGLEGPAVTVDTACSSSLVSVHLAAQALRQGECDLALAGGVSVMSTPTPFVAFSRQRGLSPDGRCKAFAESADGTGWGEGAGLVVLERLSDARRNGHRVLAVVRGSAVNQDGASNGLSAPNGPSQQRVIRRALANARLSPSEVDVVEAHGTGTTLGDPIEAQALLATYGQDREVPLLLGSVKSNFGHTQAAAGIAGLIKMVLAMRHGVVPKTLHVDEPSRHVDWSAGAVRLAVEAVEWPRSGRPRRAGVSAFGISGTNCHVIVEEAPLVEPSSEPVASPEAVPWVVSARSERALRAQAARLADFVERTKPDPADVAGALLTTRTLFRHRAIVVAPSHHDRVTALRAIADGKSGSYTAAGRARSARTGFIVPGQATGNDYSSYPVYARCVDEVSGALTEAGVLSNPHADAFTAAVAMCRLAESFGVEPAFLVGRGVGELAAAHVAGMVGLAEAGAVLAGRAPVEIEFRPSTTEVYSAATGRVLDPAETAAHLNVEGEQQIDATLAELHGRGTTRLIDLGDPAALSMERLTALFVAGLPVRWTAVVPGLDGRRTDLPTYGFQRERYWIDDSGVLDE